MTPQTPQKLWVPLSQISTTPPYRTQPPFAVYYNSLSLLRNCRHRSLSDHPAIPSHLRGRLFLVLTVVVLLLEEVALDPVLLEQLEISFCNHKEESAMQPSRQAQSRNRYCDLPIVHPARRRREGRSRSHVFPGTNLSDARTSPDGSHPPGSSTCPTPPAPAAPS